MGIMIKFQKFQHKQTIAMSNQENNLQRLLAEFDVYYASVQNNYDIIIEDLSEDEQRLIKAVLRGAFYKGATVAKEILTKQILTKQ